MFVNEKQAQETRLQRRRRRRQINYGHLVELTLKKIDNVKINTVKHV